MKNCTQIPSAVPLISTARLAERTKQEKGKTQNKSPHWHTLCYSSRSSPCIFTISKTQNLVCERSVHICTRVFAPFWQRCCKRDRCKLLHAHIDDSETEGEAGVVFRENPRCTPTQGRPNWSSPKKDAQNAASRGCVFVAFSLDSPPSSPTTHSGAENFPFFLPRLQQALAGLSLRTQTQFRFGKSIVFFFFFVQGLLVRLHLPSLSGCALLPAAVYSTCGWSAARFSAGHRMSRSLSAWIERGRGLPCLDAQKILIERKDWLSVKKQATLWCAIFLYRWRGWDLEP